MCALVSRLESPGSQGLGTFLMFLTRVELAAHEVHVSLCPFLLVLSMIVLAAPEVHVPPRVRSIASSDLCKQKPELPSTLSVTSTPDRSA